MARACRDFAVCTVVHAPIASFPGWAEQVLNQKSPKRYGRGLENPEEGGMRESRYLSLHCQRQNGSIQHKDGQRWELFFFRTVSNFNTLKILTLLLVFTSWNILVFPQSTEFWHRQQDLESAYVIFSLRIHTGTSVYGLIRRTSVESAQNLAVGVSSENGGGGGGGGGSVVRDKVTRQCPQTTTLEERGGPQC